MSHGRETDCIDTILHLINRAPIKEGKTWLRHGINTQGGLIDLMIFEGKYSKEDIARELRNKTDCRNALARIERHIDHLQNADGVDAWTGNIPHKCKLKMISGKLMFAE
jgi:hypothetical protein